MPLNPSGYQGDRRAACGFNGDIGDRIRSWCAQLRHQSPDLPRQVASKTLFALAGLVSIRDRIWTTDRLRAARRWAELTPEDGDLARLTDWFTWSGTSVDDPPDWAEVARVLEAQVATITARFGAEIGFW